MLGVNKEAFCLVFQGWCRRVPRLVLQTRLDICGINANPHHDMLRT